MSRRSPLWLLVPMLLAGCGGTKGVLPPAKAPCRADSYRPYGTNRLAYAAVVRSHAVARRRPGGRVLARFGRLNRNGVPTVLGVLGARIGVRCAAEWYRVQLPIKPNGIVAWVPASAVRVATVKTRIVVDLSARRVTLFRDGRRLLTATAAIGSTSTPTPTGRYYVNQRLIPADTSGPYGPGAVGISAFSNVLTGWTQGGPIAIHGTNEPGSIGHAVSNGCIRLPNRTLRRLFAQTLAGTPVVIHA